MSFQKHIAKVAFGGIVTIFCVRICAREDAVYPDLDDSVVVMPGFLENYLGKATIFGDQLDHTIGTFRILYISSWEWVSRRQSASSSKVPKQLQPILPSFIE